jgi:prepilin-type processing-associated H-X9-DG protein/prepilin-type N-terminal cleavage/methylation domain-containing protein
MAHLRRKAFSLIELLIVVGIVVVLVALLLPVVQSSRESARLTQCKNNLRSLGMAYHQLASARGNSATAGIAAKWISRLLPYMERQSANFVCPNDGANYGNDDENGTGGTGGSGGSTGGSMEFQPNMPPSLVFNQVESNTIARVYKERGHYALPSGITVDRSTPGTYDSNSQTSQTTIPAGTAVDVYYVHFDPVGSQSATIQNASIFFNDVILGIICFSNSLDATDKTLGAPGTAYPTGQGARGYESGAEIVTLTDDMMGFTINRFQSTFPGENTRILTKATDDGTVGGDGSGSSGVVLASYGMNNQVLSRDVLDPAQVLMTDYGKMSIDLDGKGGNNDAPTWLRLRHSGRANILFGDGSVQGIGDRGFFDPAHSLWRSYKSTKTSL